MRVLHITGYCHAGSIGGTERYVLDLIRGLEATGIQSAIGWLKAGAATDTLEADGVRIFRLPSPPMRADSPLAEFAAAAKRLLDREKPDWLHFHTFGLTEAALAKLAKQRSIPYAFTYHSPAWTCRRETALLYGKEPCDGEVRAWRCSACQSQQRLGMAPLAGHSATVVSAALGWAAMPLGRTSLRRRAAFFYDSARFRCAIRKFLSECELVVSCCDWSTPVLRHNGAREESIFHCPQGVPNAVDEAIRTKSSDLEHPTSDLPSLFVVGFVGRVVEIKGAHILMEGFSRVEGAETRLRIVGWDTAHADLPYALRLQQLAQADSRIELVSKQSFAGTLEEYRKLTLLAIPSTTMETGPLTLLEALTQGVPVYGSNRLGQLNLLRKHGRIVEPNTPTGWQVALTDALEQFRTGKWMSHQERIRATVTLSSMTDVANIMAQRYSHLC